MWHNHIKFLPKTKIKKNIWEIVQKIKLESG